MRKLSRNLMLLAGLLLLSPLTNGSAADKKATPSEVQKGYQLAKKKCTSCHDSVANPEAGRKTRDEWQIVMSVMHNQFNLQLTNQEQEQLTNYFYVIRKGLEKDPG